jgi:DNA topoisomerase-1
VSKKLVIVESPAKAETIKKILGRNYDVMASYGHIRDLPKSKIGVDIENNFTPSYKTIRGKAELVKKLKTYAKKADKVFLASDMDREGEAIAWHVANLLKLNLDDNIRIEFNEITKTAIKEAIKKPRKIDINKVDAQQARRILDRLVGYKISPLLWKVIESNTSAGRVQSVALKLICDLEEEIQNFVPEKYWEVKGLFNDEFNFTLNKIDDKKVSKIKDKEVVDILKSEIKKDDFTVVSVKTSNKIKNPPLPLKTSTLQQLASSYLGFSASKTMRIAQSLYEGLEIDGVHKGLITYMRTDSTRISDEAKEAAKEYIINEFGKEYVNIQKDKKTKAKIQDAHEGIRPTDINLTPDYLANKLNSDQFKLYRLIWERFLISQLAPMKYKSMEILTSDGKYTFRGVANKIIFDGYYKVFKEEDEIQNSSLPNINENDKFTLTKLNIIEGVTKPPARLTESSLVKKLESEGIGRPSTYASIIETLKKREYVTIEGKKFIPTNLGFTVKNELEKYFPNIMNIKFTANMEENLDKIETGEINWINLLNDFYNDLKAYLEKFEEEVKKIEERRIESDVTCTKCNGIMLLKTGRFGKYLLCENEECDEKISLKGIDIPKEDIEKGKIYVKEAIEKKLEDKNGKKTDMYTENGKNLLLKYGRFGSYLESENYKEDNIRISLPSEIRKMLAQELVKEENNIVYLKEIFENIKKEEEQIIKEAGKCEKCGSPFEIKRGRFGKFLACTGYPECKNIKKIPKK